jgi:hypothetical protein
VTTTLFKTLNLKMHQVMKAKIMFAWSIASLLLVTACTQEQADPIDYYFYTTEEAEAEQWTLYVDGDEVGPLPYRESAPACNLQSELGSMLHISLTQGKHTFEAKDLQGVVRSDGYIKCKDNEEVQTMRLGSSGGNAACGASATWSCDYVTVAVWDLVE